MRQASELANQICGCATREQHQRDIALIEADRAAQTSGPKSRHCQTACPVV